MLIVECGRDGIYVVRVGARRRSVQNMSRVKYFWGSFSGSRRMSCAYVGKS